MANKRRKEIAFDLDTDALSEYFGSYTQGYGALKYELNKLGFVHTQHSVYVSDKPMSRPEVTEIVAVLVQKCPWLPECANEFTVANVPIHYNLLPDIKEVGKQYEEKAKEKKRKMQIKRRQQMSM